MSEDAQMGQTAVAFKTDELTRERRLGGSIPLLHRFNPPTCEGGVGDDTRSSEPNGPEFCTSHHDIRTTVSDAKAWRRLRRKPLEQRFWALVDDSSGPDGCWPFMGDRNHDGYGRLQEGSRQSGNRKTHLAHRLALELKLGRELLAGECALHACDNPPCVNPAHLRAGTKTDNHADMVSRGRRVEASRKLTDEQVGEIRRRVLAGEPGTKLGREFGVSSRLVYYIRDGLKGRDRGHASAGVHS